MTQVRTDGAVTLVKFPASAAIVKTVHACLNGNSSLVTNLKVHNKFVREVLSLIHVRSFPSFLL